MLKVFHFFVAIVVLSLNLGLSEVPAPVQADGKSLSVQVLPGTYAGRVVDKPVKLEIGKPETRPFSVTVPIPGNHAAYMDGWRPWPSKSKTGPLAVGISPKKDDDNHTILGPLYNSIQPGTLVITSADGKQTFERDKDFRFSDAWNQISNIEGRLGTPGEGELKVAYTYATQRLDLVQIDAQGVVSVKPGKSVMVCPQLPAPDAGAAPIAGVYVAPWQREGAHVIQQQDIYPVVASAPVEPVNPAAITPVLKKLKAGDPVTIAFLGDSVTLGAEAGAWWDGMFTESNTTYATRVILGLKKLYPQSQITPVHAAKGATTTSHGVNVFDELVVAKKPDLVFIAYGLNDAAGAIGKEPTNPVANFKEDIRNLVKRSQSAGASVILVSPMQPNPWIENKIAERIVDYREALRALSKEENVGFADVYAAWMKQADAGVPPFSQLHNWNNHPGIAGHAVYAETILRFFGDVKLEAPVAPAVVPAAKLVPAKPVSGFAPVVQPTEIPGKWEFAPPPLPDLQTTLKNARHNPHIYGLYTWINEFREHRESIRQVGWKSIRAGGTMDDASMASYVTDDLEIMHTFGRQKVKDEPAARAQYLIDYPKQLDELLTRYGPGGTFFKDHPELPNRPIRYVEILNEPNFQYMIAPDGRPQKELEAARESLYAQLLPAAYAVKQKHKDVTFVGFGAGGASAGDERFIRNVLAAGPQVAKSFDILSTHPYVQPAPPDAYSVRSWGKYSIASGLKAIRGFLASHERADIPIWYTEIGWPVSKADGGHFETKDEPMVSPLLQAAYIVRLYALSQRLGVERVHIMNATDTDQFNAGFFLRDRSWRPSAKAVQTMIKLMPSPKLIGAITDGTDGTFVYRFASDDRADAPETIMAWNVSGPKSITLPAASPQAIVTDMLGNEQTIAAVDNQLPLPIGPAPVYVRWVPAPGQP
jgi:lysophospholipase L1-like esterase